jgi:hypothetical protein
MRRGLALAATVASLCVGAQSASADVVDDKPAAATGSGQTYVAARASNGETMVKSWSNATWGWSPWQSIGGFSSSGPSVSMRPDGTTDYFVRGGDNALYHRFRRPDGSWADWGWLGGGLTSAPSAVVRKGTNNIDVVVRGGGGNIYWKEWTPSTGWSEWADLGGWSQDAPTIVSTVDGGVDIFYRGGDNQIYAKILRNNNWSTWSNWTPFGGGACSAPTAESPADGAVDVFYTACDGSIYQRSWSGTGWSDWLRHEAYATSAPAAIANGKVVTLYVRGGSRIYYNQWNGANAWSGFQDFGSPDEPNVPSPPSPPRDSECVDAGTAAAQLDGAFVCSTSERSPEGEELEVDSDGDRLHGPIFSGPAIGDLDFDTAGLAREGYGDHDNPHVSSDTSSGYVISVHGFWNPVGKMTDDVKATKLEVRTVLEQHWGGRWVQVATKTGKIKPGGGGGKRVTARSPCTIYGDRTYTYRTRVWLKQRLPIIPDPKGKWFGGKRWKKVQCSAKGW